MDLNKISQNSTLDKSIAICLATFSMFILGYSITRAYLGKSFVSNTSQQQETLIAHQTQMWSVLGE